MEFQQEINSTNIYKKSIKMIFKWIKCADSFES